MVTDVTDARYRSTSAAPSGARASCPKPIEPPRRYRILEGRGGAHDRNVRCVRYVRYVRLALPFHWPFDWLIGPASAAFSADPADSRRLVDLVARGGVAGAGPGHER